MSKSYDFLFFSPFLFGSHSSQSCLQTGFAIGFIVCSSRISPLTSFYCSLCAYLLKLACELRAWGYGLALCFLEVTAACALGFPEHTRMECPWRAPSPRLCTGWLSNFSVCRSPEAEGFFLLYGTTPAATCNKKKKGNCVICLEKVAELHLLCALILTKFCEICLEIKMCLNTCRSVGGQDGWDSWRNL